MRNLLLYALGAGGMCYLAVLYRSRGVLALGIFVLLLSPVFMYLLQSVGRRMECGLFYSAYPDGTGKYRVWIEVENPTSIAIPSLCAKVVLRHRATGRVCKVKLRGRIEAGQSACLEGGLERPEFGQWQMECKGLCCYDWLGIYRFWKKLGDKKQIILFPECYQTTVRAGVRTRLFSSESERYHPQMNGDDPAETLELREYQKGDIIHGSGCTCRHHIGCTRSHRRRACDDFSPLILLCECNRRVTHSLLVPSLHDPQPAGLTVQSFSQPYCDTMPENGKKSFYKFRLFSVHGYILIV